MPLVRELKIEDWPYVAIGWVDWDMPLYDRAFETSLSARGSTFSWPSLVKFVAPEDLEYDKEDKQMTVKEIREKYGPLAEGEPKRSATRRGEREAVPLITE